MTMEDGQLRENWLRFVKLYDRSTLASLLCLLSALAVLILGGVVFGFSKVVASNVAAVIVVATFRFFASHMFLGLTRCYCPHCKAFLRGFCRAMCFCPFCGTRLRPEKGS